MKQQLKKELIVLEDELNKYLAGEYGVGEGDKVAYAKWVKFHQPFHWFIQFYGILKNGGFDVIIGNPPYVEYKEVKKDYTVKGYTTEECGNLYTFIIERNEKLLLKNGFTGMIIPHSAICTDRMAPLIQILSNSPFWVSSYDIRPAKLFIGVDQRLAIFLKKKTDQLKIFCTKYHRWNEENRLNLFQQLQYMETNVFKYENSLPKIGFSIELRIYTKLTRQNFLSEQLVARGSNLFFHNSPRYWIRALTFAPYFSNERDGEKLSTQVKILYTLKKIDASVITAILNTSLYYWWFLLFSDCRHLNLREIESFHAGLDTMTEVTKKKLAEILGKLMKDFKKHAIRTETVYQTTGKVVYDEYYPRFSKSILDEIDTILAENYGFTEEELDFIINYDIKYRMGKEIE